MKVFRSGFVFTLIFMLSVILCQESYAGRSGRAKKGKGNEITVRHKTSVQTRSDEKEALSKVEESKSELPEEFADFFNDEKGSHLDQRKKNLQSKQERYCTGNFSIAKVCKTILKETSVTGLTAGLTAMGTYCALSYMGTDPESQGSTIALATAVTSTVNSAVNGSVQNIMKAIRECKMTLEEGLKEVFAELVKESKDIIKSLPEDFQDRIKQIDVKVAQALENKGSSDVVLKLMKRREEVYLAYPNRAKNIAHYDKNGNAELEKKIDRRVEKLLNQYPENREALSVLIQSMRDNSIVSSPQRVQAYLYGPAGTGKTTFVRKLGKALGLYVCEIKLTDLEPNSLLGPEHPDDWMNSSDSEAIGKVGNCFRQAGYQNIIVFFDEAGEYLGDSVASKGFDVNAVKKQMIQAQFKKLMDPNDLYIELKGIGVKIDSSRATFIMAGNYPVQNEALLSRTPQLHFKELKLSEKRKAAEDGFNKAINTLNEFSKEEDVNEIRKIAIRYFDFILEEDNKRNPGGRIIKDVIKEFINHVRIVKMNENRTGTPIKESELKNFILESFKRREKVAEPAVSASSSSTSGTQTEAGE